MCGETFFELLNQLCDIVGNKFLFYKFLPYDRFMKNKLIFKMRS